MCRWCGLTYLEILVASPLPLKEGGGPDSAIAVIQLMLDVYFGSSRLFFYTSLANPLNHFKPVARLFKHTAFTQSLLNETANGCFCYFVLLVLFYVSLDYC